MEYEELKAKIYSKFCGTGRQKEIDELFEQYEKENEEITEENIKNIGEKFQSWNAKAFHKALTDYHNQIESMQKEIEPIQKEIFELSCFRKKFGECLDNQRNDLNLLKKHILDLQDELLTLKRDLKFEKEQENPKQERFYFKSSQSIQSTYIIFDRDNKIMFNCDYSFEAARESCINLNSLAKGE